MPLQKLFDDSEGCSCEQLVIGTFRHNSVPARASRLLQSFLEGHQITQVTQPPTTGGHPDLAPCDLWLFPKLKSPLKGKTFQIVNEIQENSMGQLMAVGTV